jgi:hypothetical protein
LIQDGSTARFNRGRAAALFARRRMRFLHLPPCNRVRASILIHPARRCLLVASLHEAMRVRRAPELGSGIAVFLGKHSQACRNKTA